MTELFCAVEFGILLEIFIEFTPRLPNGISDKNTLENTPALKDYGISLPARWCEPDTIALKKSAE